ncbi:MAG TPA: DUF2254 domain-containing protein [Pyrinomonadaceae bacterium]|nr:DUF2254 domain-containing protein [Pyrinomonadaceae bacterium]
MGKLKKFLIDVRSSLWFLPSLLVLGSVLLALGLIEVDLRLDPALREAYPRFFAVEAEGSRAMLSAVAGSMITVAGVVFSVVIVSLSLASTQYTSRVLRNFMRDRANQAVLGVFLGIFAYCIVVLRTFSAAGAGEEFVPSIAILTGALLSLVGLGFLIFFIHHTAAAVQASEIIASITEETTAAIDKLFPEELGAGDESPGAAGEGVTNGGGWRLVPSTETGYVQTVEVETLLSFAKERGVCIKVARGAGEFAAEGKPIVFVSASREPTPEEVKALNAAFAVGNYRTAEQDPAFGIRQLVDIALKALSPGINDTTTAINCIDYLGFILSRLAPRRLDPRRTRGDDGHRVILKEVSFENYVDEAFNQIRQNAEGNVSVLIRMLGAVREVAANVQDEGRRSILSEHVELILELARRSVPSERDLDQVEEEGETTKEALTAVVVG